MTSPHLMYMSANSLWTGRLIFRTYNKSKHGKLEKKLISGRHCKLKVILYIVYNCLVRQLFQNNSNSHSYGLISRESKVSETYFFARYFPYRNLTIINSSVLTFMECKSQFVILDSALTPTSWRDVRVRVSLNVSSATLTPSLSTIRDWR